MNIIRPLWLAEMVCELRKAVAIYHFLVLVAALLANTHVLSSKCFIKHCVSLHSYWLKYEHLKFIMFGVKKPYVFEAYKAIPCGFLLFWRDPWLPSSSETHCFLSRFYKQVKRLTLDTQVWNTPHPSVHSLRSQGCNACWISSKFEARHIRICRIFGCFMLNKIWNSVLISGLNCDTNLSYFLNCVPGYHCLILVFITVDTNITSEGSPQRVNTSSWTYHLCWQGSRKAFPTSKSLAASAPVLFLWHLCIIKK